MLAALVADAGTVVSKQALLDASWRDTFVSEASLLDVIRVLREALGDNRQNPRYIQTVHRRGYRFIAPVTAIQPNPPHPPNQPHQAHQPDQPIFWQRAEWRPLIAASTAAIVTTMGVALVFALFGQRPPETRPTVRFTIELAGSTAIDPLRGSVAVSADGTKVVYVATEEGQRRLYLRTIDRDSPEPIDGSDEAADPFFSPDGNWIGFFAHGSLKKLRVEGGTPVVLCAARAGAGASWGPDGTIVFGGGPGNGLARVSERGGDPVVLAAPGAGSPEVRYGWPDLLPDGRRVIFTAVGLADRSVALLDLATGARTTLVEHAAFGRYSPTGHLVFERRGRLEAAPFSLTHPQLVASARPILRGLATAGATLAGPRFAFSRTGSLVYVPGLSNDTDDRLHWMDGTGQLEPVHLPPGAMDTVEVAPNQRQLAIAVEGDSGQDLWLGDLERGALSRLTADGRSVGPAWRPDGLEIAFAYSKAGPFNLFLRPATGDGAPEPLSVSPWNQLPTSWSPDGRWIAFTEFNPLTGADVWLLDVKTRERRPAVRTVFDESHARFSPDGQWLAYMSNESGRWEVLVRPVDRPAPRVQVSTTGGAWPCWSVDGRTLYFSVGGHVAAVAVEGGRSLRVSAPLLIPGPNDIQVAGGVAGRDRLLVREAGSQPSRHELRVVVEWFAELTRLVREPA